MDGDLAYINFRITQKEQERDNYKEKGQEDAVRRVEKELKQLYIKRRKMNKV